MGAKGGRQQSTAQFLQDYQVVEQVDSECLMMLRSHKNNEQFLLREFTFNDRKQFEKYMETLQQRKLQLGNCKHVAQLQQILSKAEDQYCSTYYKIYALFRYTHRTLHDEINQRKAQQRPFQEKDLWSILASCILGMSHLQKHGIKHQSLSSNAILLSRQGVIRVYDPIATGVQTNYDTLLTKRQTPHIYLSPQLGQSLQRQTTFPHSHPYKSDIWTTGMIILQAGLNQYQDECYRDQSSRVHWQTLQYNIHRFRQCYSVELAGLIELMLSREEKDRPDWIQLEERVIKEEQTRSSIHSLGRANRINRVANRSSQNRPTQPQSRGFTKTHDHIFATSHPIPPPPPPQQIYHPVSAPVPPPPSYSPRNSAYTQQGGVVPVSNIERSRPVRNIFPQNTYITKTVIDENLIVVPEDEAASEEESHQNREDSSYFQSYHKSHNEQPTRTFYSNPFISASDERPTVTTYAVNQIERQPSQGIQSTVNKSMKGSQGQSQYVNQKYKQGSQYRGYKVNGLRDGHGVFYYQDGGMYQGQWKENKMHGRGKLYYQSGRLAYEGQWYNDQFSGQGCLYNQYPSPTQGSIDYRNLDQIDEKWTKYQGQFRQDLKHGHGMLFVSNGQYFQGTFEDDLAQGQGIYHLANGKQIRGLWQKNMLVS